jgi:hypothetical protein
MSRAAAPPTDGPAAVTRPDAMDQSCKTGQNYNFTITAFEQPEGLQRPHSAETDPRLAVSFQSSGGGPGDADPNHEVRQAGIGAEGIPDRRAQADQPGGALPVRLFQPGEGIIAAAEGGIEHRQGHGIQRRGRLEALDLGEHGRRAANHGAQVRRVGPLVPDNIGLHAGFLQTPLRRVDPTESEMGPVESRVERDGFLELLDGQAILPGSVIGVAERFVADEGQRSQLD